MECAELLRNKTR